MFSILNSGVREKNNMIDGKEFRRKYDIYIQEEKERLRKQVNTFRLENPLRWKEITKKFRQSDKGKLSRIKVMARRRKKFPIDVTVKEMNFIKQRDKNCIYCGSNERLSIDHIDPNGGTVIGNLAIACRSCNSSKGTKDVHEWLKSKFL